MSTDTGENLLNPGDTPHDNAQFLVFCVAVIRAVAKYPELLRVSVCGAANDHRLGANEAPPAIISDLPGRPVAGRDRPAGEGRGQEHQAGRLHGDRRQRAAEAAASDAGDRNRTSPFAFTGNKFEFRAVGGSQSIAGPNTVLNTIVAESLDFIATHLEKAKAAGKDLNKAIQDLLPGIIKESKKVLFNGDNYTPEWHTGGGEARPAQPAQHRGVPAGDPAQGQRSSCSASTRSTASASCRAGWRSWPRTTSRR